MKLSPKQKIISESKKRFKVAVCGRRFGKTYLAINEAAKIARYPNKTVFLIVTP